jgi:hypothetical protein
MPSIKELQEELAEQEATITEVTDILEAVYTPEASRADLVEAVSDALDILAGEEESESEESPEDDD